MTGRPIIQLFAVSISGQARVLTGLTRPPGRVLPVLVYTVNIASGKRNKTKLLLMSDVVIPAASIPGFTNCKIKIQSAIYHDRVTYITYTRFGS